MTNLDTTAVLNTYLQTRPIAKVFAKTISGQLLASPGICQLYLFQYNRCLKQISCPLLSLCTYTGAVLAAAKGLGYRLGADVLMKTVATYGSRNAK